MSDRGQAVSLTAGGFTISGGWNAQNCRPFSTSIAGRLRRRRAARVGRAHLDPLLEVGDDRAGSRPSAASEAIVRVADRGDQQAFVGFARHDRRAGVAPLAQALAAVDQEAAFDFCCAFASGTWRTSS